jgi:hypothetical protein
MLVAMTLSTPVSPNASIASARRIARVSSIASQNFRSSRRTRLRDPDRDSSSSLERIDHRDSATFEVPRVAGGERELVRLRDGPDQHVRMRGLPACLP